MEPGDHSFSHREKSGCAVANKLCVFYLADILPIYHTHNNLNVSNTTAVIKLVLFTFHNFHRENMK